MDWEKNFKNKTDNPGMGGIFDGDYLEEPQKQLLSESRKWLWWKQLMKLDSLIMI